VIPRVFHQIWVGEQPFPDDFRPLVETWARHHPEWELRLWTDENLPDGLRPEIYELLRHPAERADMLRLELLHRFGGVYIDVDFECLKPIDALLEGVSAFLGALDSGRVSNAIIGSQPGHELFERAVRELRPRTTYGPIELDGTGPLLLDRLRHEYPDVKIFEPEVFYATTPESAVYAYHLPARTWKHADALRSDLRRAEQARAYAQDELARVQKELDALRAGRPLLASFLRLRRLGPRKMRRLLRRLQ
jgi:mannosyltransferase OCH1-like enzyme